MLMPPVTVNAPPPLFTTMLSKACEAAVPLICCAPPPLNVTVLPFVSRVPFAMVKLPVRAVAAPRETVLPRLSIVIFAGVFCVRPSPTA